MEPNLALTDMSDPDFWSEYEKFMREPIDDRATLDSILSFVGIEDYDDEGEEIADAA